MTINEHSLVFGSYGTGTCCEFGVLGSLFQHAYSDPTTIQQITADRFLIPQLKQHAPAIHTSLRLSR